jgi:hypothetical protein
VVSVTDPYGRILGFLDRSRYFSIKIVPYACFKTVQKKLYFEVNRKKKFKIYDDIDIISSCKEVTFHIEASPEDDSSTFFRNICIHIPDYTMAQSRRLP